VRREIGNVLREGAHVALLHESSARRSAAIDFGVHLEAVDVVKLASGLIVVVRNWRRFLRTSHRGAEYERKPDGSRDAEAGCRRRASGAPLQRRAFVYWMINDCASAATRSAWSYPRGGAVA